MVNSAAKPAHVVDAPAVAQRLVALAVGSSLTDLRHNAAAQQVLDPVVLQLPHLHDAALRDRRVVVGKDCRRSHSRGVRRRTAIPT